MIVGDLKLEKNIGKGSFCEVYLTSKKDDTKKYATKKIERAKIENTEAIKYLRNEAIIIKNLNHPNIIKIEDIKKSKNNFYIVMEFCNGGTLSKALEKYESKYGSPFPEEIVQHFMRQIINAFKYIHKQKLIHRDIILDNILLNFETEEDKNNLNLMKATVKIIDFGFTFKKSKTGLKYAFSGSPINMDDPIILKKLNSSGKTRKLGSHQKEDILSLGNICYKMLKGKDSLDIEYMEELDIKDEKGIYKVPDTFSKEAISFLNGMLLYNPLLRLNCEQLSRHNFLIKNVKDFQKIKKKVIVPKRRKTIWSIFEPDFGNELNKKDDIKFSEPNEEKEEL